jgi:mono/diheme cytochrome c family protein
MSIEFKAALLGLTAALALLGVTLGLSPFLQPATAAGPRQVANMVAVTASAAPAGDAMRGHSLFDHNCAHCHGDDARGDEGPSLYDLKKSDARITKIIKGGIKGEMPRFGTKFNDPDIQSIIAYLRTLKS